MAASKDKASALKDSYVDGIIDELGGQSDPAVRMAMRENDVASMHVFPSEGKMGMINDGDPTMYIHGGGKSYDAMQDSNFANPIGNQGPGGRMIDDMPQDAINEGQQYLDNMERRMGGSGDLARMRPKSKEDFERKPRVLGSAGAFDASNLAGAMGMEQGNTAGVVMDLQNGIRIRKNDGNPRLVIRDGSRRAVVNHPESANPLRGGYGASDVDRIPRHMQSSSAGLLHSIGNRIDTTVYDGSPGGDNLGKMYSEQMYQPYTH